VSEHLDFDYPLTPDGHDNLLAEVSGHRDAALRQLRLAGATNDPQPRLSAATVHALTALTLLIADDIEPSGTDTDAVVPPRASTPLSLRYSVPVSVFHNLHPATARTGYCDEDDEVVEVYAYSDRDVPDTVSDLDIAARVIGLFGTEHDLTVRAADYRVANYFERGNRTLAGGDVIAVDRRYYTLTATGLTPIAQPRIAFRGLELPTGTTRL